MGPACGGSLCWRSAGDGHPRMSSIPASGKACPACHVYTTGPPFGFNASRWTRFGEASRGTAASGKLCGFMSALRLHVEDHDGAPRTGEAAKEGPQEKWDSQCLFAGMLHTSWPATNGARPLP
jgi:hypothetical protein